MRGGKKLRKNCLVCTKIVTKSALNSMTCCSKCATNLKIGLSHVITDESDLETIRQQTGLTEAVFTELLHRLGIYSPSWIAENVGSLANLAKIPLLGVAENYDNPGKNKDRTFIIGQANLLLKDQPVALLTLPHVGLLCYLEAAARLNLDPSASTLVERDNLYFNILWSLKKAWQSFSDGEILRDVTVFKGTVAKSLQQLPKVYNFVNLDFLGPWTEEDERTVRRLFHNGRLEDESLVSITLSEARRFIDNPMPQYSLVEEPHKNFVVEKFKELARGTVYSPIYLWHHTYNTESSYPMVSIVFRVKKKAS